MRASILFVAITLGLGCASNEVVEDDDSSSPAPTPPDDDTTEPRPTSCVGGEAKFAAVLSQFESELRSNGVPGGSIAVVCNGQLAFAAGIGTTQAGGTQPVTADSRFQLASTTKMFTGAAAWRMHGNQIDLDAAIDGHLPEVSYSQVTLRQLLTHTAGFPTLLENPTSPDLEGMVLANTNTPLWAPPGAVWNYSNPGFSVAGLVLQRAARAPFADVVQQHVFLPASMDRATFSVPDVIADGDYALGHEGSTANVVDADGAYFETGFYGPMGGAWASATDLARWAEFVLAEDDLGWRRGQTSTGTPGQQYGHGLFIDESVTPAILSHSGSTVGYLADWQMVFDEGFAVAVLVNADWYWPGDISQAALDAFVTFTPASVTWPTAPDSWDRYVGSYDDSQELGTMHVRIDGDRLVAQFEATGTEAELIPWFADSYFVEHPSFGEIDVTFWRDDAAANASYLVSLWGVAARR